jgi:GGDEF domain-containing protein
MAMNRRVIESMFKEAELPGEFSVRKLKSQCKEPFSVKFFDCQNNVMKILAQRVGFDLSMITIKLANDKEFSQSQVDAIYETLCDVLSVVLRETDQVYSQVDQGSFSVVLPGTHVDNVEMVIEKLEKSLKERDPSLFSKAEYSFDVEALHAE